MTQGKGASLRDRVGGPTDLSRDASQPKALIPCAKKRGRPPIKDRDSVRAAPLQCRITPRVKRMLEVAAETNGRSLAQEVQSRLELSLAGDVLDMWHK